MLRLANLWQSSAKDPTMIDRALQYMKETGHSGDQPPLFPYMKEMKDKFDREMALPPKRVDFINRSDLIQTLRITQEQTDNFRDLAARGRRTDVEIEIGVRLRFSSKNLDDLERISASELMIRKAYEGRYFLCRTICPIVFDSGTAILAAGEDPDGDAVYLKFFNHPMLMDTTRIEMDAVVFPVGTILAIREPFYVGGAFSGPSEFPFVKVDSPSDIVVLDVDHPVLRDVTWKKTLYLPPDDSVVPRPPTTSKAWKARGTEEFKSGRWFASAMCFTQCIDTGYEVQISRLNRSEVYLRLGWYNSAFKDAEMALDSGTLDKNMETKAIVRMLKAQYALRQYDRVLEIAKSLPEDKVVMEWVAKASKRKAEQMTGNFDWATLFKEAKQSCYSPDIANFVGPIETGFREGPIKLRGTFAARDIKVGELLIFEKPICSYWEKEDNNVFLKIHYIPSAKTYDKRAVYRLICALVQKVWDDKDTYASVRALYGGSNQAAPIEGSQSPGTHASMLENPMRPVVDIDIDYLMNAVVTNSFGCGTIFPSPDADLVEHDEGYGLYKAASLLNHSCDPSSRSFFLGDANVIRATRNIKKGEEITTSYSEATAYDERQFRLMYSWGFNCTCDLCLNESKDDADDRKKRKELGSTTEKIFNMMSQTTSVGTLRQLLSKAKVCWDDIRRTYTGERTSGNHADVLKYELAQATRWYAMCVGRLANAESDPATYKRALELKMDSLEFDGLHVNDRSLSGPIVGGKKAPLPLDLKFVSAYHDINMMTIYKMVGIFELLGERKRAQRWFDAAVEMHNLAKGGGKAVFQTYQAKMLTYSNLWKYV